MSALRYQVRCGPSAPSNAFSTTRALPALALIEKALLGPHGPHLTCYRKADVPERFHYGRNPRVPAILCMPDDGWTVLAHPAKYTIKGGAHGYDNFAPDMLALFLASGPAIKPLGKIATF